MSLFHLGEQRFVWYGDQIVGKSIGAIVEAHRSMLFAVIRTPKVGRGIFFTCRILFVELPRCVIICR